MAAEVKQYALETEGREPMGVQAVGEHAALEAAFLYWQYTLAGRISITEDGREVASLTIEIIEEEE